MVHSVACRELPRGLKFPDDLASRIWHDPAEGRLCFEGFMSKATYDRLDRLHADLAYREALAELFRISVPDELAHRRAIGSLVAVVGSIFGRGRGGSR